MRTVSAEGPGSDEYERAAAFIADWGRSLGLDVSVVSPVERKPIVFMKLLGRDSSLPAVLLNSHYDVVPAVEECWEVDPWAGVRKDGKIYGRGTQDMKSVSIQYLVALQRILTKHGRMGEGATPPQGLFLRDLCLSFVPDEEIGGQDGMGAFLKTELWHSQRIGVALDEGLANPGEAYTVFYGERNPWWIIVKARGNVGHGSRFVPATAVEKLMAIAEKALAFRRAQECLLGHSGGCSHAKARKLGDVTSLNLTMLKAGVSSDGGRTFALNVIPVEAEAGFDIRISPDTDPAEIRAMLNEWTSDDDVSWSHAPGSMPMDKHYVTQIDRKTNPWWGVLEDAFADVGAEIEPEIFPAGTDSRLLRERQIPAFGFSPLRSTPVLLHDHNEFVSEAVFLEGVGVYEKLIPALADAPAMSADTPTSTSHTSGILGADVDAEEREAVINGHAAGSPSPPSPSKRPRKA